MNKSRKRQLLFRDDDDKILFLDSIGRAVERYNLEVHAYSLMPTHFHLLVRCPEANLSLAVGNLTTSFSQLANLRHNRDGSMFRGRFKSQLVKNEAYLIYLLSYIHRNPLKANLITRLDAEDAWTSHREYLGRSAAHRWLSRDFFLELLGGPKGVNEAVLKLHRKAMEWPPGMNTDTGWINWKHADFGGHECKNARGHTKTIKTETLMGKICSIVGADERELRKQKMGKRGNPERRFAVWALWKSTAMTHSQIGALLGMSAPTVAKDLSRTRKKIQEFEKWSRIWLEEFSDKVSCE